MGTHKLILIRALMYDNCSFKSKRGSYTKPQNTAKNNMPMSFMAYHLSRLTVRTVGREGNTSQPSSHYKVVSNDNSRELQIKVHELERKRPFGRLG